MLTIHFFAKSNYLHMSKTPFAHIYVIIPAFNEQNAVCNVLAEIPKDLVTEIIVVNNGSTDNTVEQARSCGATVLDEHSKGYGYACLKGIDYLLNKPISDGDIIVFIDADYSDYPGHFIAQAFLQS